MAKATNRDLISGRFIAKGNCFTEKGGLVYCYTTDGELMFFTDIKAVTAHSWAKYSNGYFCTRINGEAVPLHRFLKKPGRHEVVDHINRDKRDNRISNLRNTNKSINAFNSCVRANNTSGTTGVWYRKDTCRWVAEIKVNYKKISLGNFITLEDAIMARKAAEDKYYAYQQ